MLCPHCKKDVTEMHKVSRQVAKKHPDVKIHALCPECDGPLVRMVYGFRKPTNEELPAFEIKHLIKPDVRDIYPDQQIAEYWETLKTSILKGIAPGSTPAGIWEQMGGFFEMTYYLGARAAKNAIREVMSNPDFGQDATVGLLSAIDEQIDTKVKALMTKELSELFNEEIKS
jgi:hypothetical protein